MNFWTLIRSLKNIDLNKLEQLRPHIKNISIDEVETNTLDVFMEFDAEGMKLAKEIMPQLMKMLADEQPRDEK